MITDHKKQIGSPRIGVKVLILAIIPVPPPMSYPGATSHTSFQQQKTFKPLYNSLTMRRQFGAHIYRNL